MIRYRPISLLPIFVALALGGCVSAPVSLASKHWDLHTINDELLYGDRGITLVFDSDNELSGSAGCNDYRAHYSSKDGVLTVDSISRTKMQCGEEVMAQEKRYLEMLGDAATFVDKCGYLIIHSQEGDLLRFNLHK